MSKTILDNMDNNFITIALIFKGQDFTNVYHYHVDPSLIFKHTTVSRMGSYYLEIFLAFKDNSK